VSCQLSVVTTKPTRKEPRGLLYFQQQLTTDNPYRFATGCVDTFSFSTFSNTTA